MNARAQLLLELADDELILGWRDSEWTGIAPVLEEDVAFSSIAQNEIGHARALYELAAPSSGRPQTSWRSTARPRSTAARRSSSCACSTGRATIARRWLYEVADAMRIEALKASDDAELAGLAAKIDREEAYHRMHAELWAERLRDEPRFQAAVDELWPYALGVLRPELRAGSPARRRGSPSAAAASSAAAARPTSCAELWDEMTGAALGARARTW